MSDTFDFEDWTSGATRLQRSCLIYRKPHLVARLDEISQSRTTAGAVGLDVSEYDDEWVVVAQEFSDSALRLVFEHRSVEEIQAVMAAAIPADDEEIQQAMLIADSLVSPVMTWQQVLDLRAVVGDNQILVLVEAWTAASFGEVPLAPVPAEIVLGPEA